MEVLQEDAWMRKKIKIVNFHDCNIVKYFYCDVLKAERTHKLKSGHISTLKLAAKASTACFDLEVRNYWWRQAHKNDGSPDTKESFQGEADVIEGRVNAMGLDEGDLPKEFLVEAKQEKLLSVSLDYEKILLPKTYALGGEKKLKKNFLDFFIE